MGNEFHPKLDDCTICDNSIRVEVDGLTYSGFHPFPESFCNEPCINCHPEANKAIHSKEDLK